MQGLEEDGQTYLLPHPAIMRVILTLAGLFALIGAPYELLGGVWPPSLLTPFFGFIMLGVPWRSGRLCLCRRWRALGQARVS